MGLKETGRMSRNYDLVPPACIKWMIDHNASKMFSHVFALKGSPKTGDGKWVEEDAWLREHHEEYDALYQQTHMEEEEHVEHEYHEQQRKRIQELREKTKSTMRRTLYWEENAWPERTYIDQYDMGHYQPKTENTSSQNIGQIRLLVGKYKKIEVVVNTNRFVAQKAPMKIENVLLHPRVKRPTRASKAYNRWKPENEFNWWGIHGEENPLTYGMENANAVLKNKYSSRLPGYLSIRSDYTKLACMIPCPTKNLRDPTDGEKYCVYVAYGGLVPRKDGKFLNYISPILKNGYSILAQPYILLPANTYCLILLIVTEKLKWRMVNMYGRTWLDTYYYRVSEEIS
jgi:hypothetical protein